jgi:hypothetical protein
LALGALASCEKENTPVEEAKNKTIEINVLNLVEESRAVAGGDTAKGTEKLCAEFGELKVLFVEADGKIAHEDTLVANNDNNMTDDSHDAISGEYVKDETYNNNGTRRWHNVPASIKKIAVVRYEATDFAQGCVGKDLEDDVLALAQNMEENVNRPIETMVLCGVGALSDTGATHMVGDALYHVWKAEVNVAPAFARFEVRSIKCTDLGALNADGDDATYDLDELKLKSLTWNYTDATGNVAYTAPADFGATLYGVYAPAADYTYKYDQNTCTAAERSAEYKPTKGAWSWNVLPGEFQDLTVDIDGYAYDYQVSYKADESDRNFPLYVSGLATSRDDKGNVTGEDNKFEAGNIYHIDLIFKQENIKSQDGICVDVVVTVNAWKVVERYPIYGNN